MTDNNALAKLERMKGIRKALSVVTLIAALVSIAVLLAYNFMPVTTLTGPAEMHFVGCPYDYPGWQMIFYGIGRQYIMQDHLFDPNPITIVGMLGTLLVLVICTATYNRGRNMGKAVREFIMAAFLVYSAIVLGALIVPVAYTAAIDGQTYGFRTNYLDNPACSFTAMPFATVICIALLLTAAVKAGNGAFLLYQKSFAAKYAPKKPKGDQ